ncbi:flagellar protein FlgN [Microvirga tunisiensis]|uniref:Flagellar protein FlgN n=3 Tax=Pannonibacter tanglangensis TaxID=2750084 RepID=A0ABW9ZHX0_9HYPH|nr:flagellar protein FlgN [Pannonibacter sp. XCT-34]NBN77169.1 flagellar protein FlgN [Pannonibacter sp. XCT-53]
MERLLEVVETETDLVRAGQLRAAGDLQGEKAVLVHHYTQGVLYAKEHSVALGNLAPAAVQALRRQHAEFQPVLRINLAVLATAREVADSIVNTVARAVGAKQRTTTYGPAGAPPAAPRPAEGISVNRSL